MKIKTNVLSSEYHSVVSDFLFRVLAEVCSFIFSILTFSIISRMLIKEDYAIVNQTLSLAILITPIILLRLNSTFCVFLAPIKNKQTQISRYISMFLLTLPFCIGLWLFLTVNSSYMSKLLFADEKYNKYLILIATYFVLCSWSTFSIEFFRGLTRLKTSTFFVLLRTVLISASLVTLAYGINILNLYTVLLCYCLVEFCVLLSTILYIFYVFYGTKIVVDFNSLKDHLSFALPLIPYTVMSWANIGLSRIILNHLMALKDAAIYGFNYSVVTKIFFLNTVIGYIIYPYISRFWGENNSEKVKTYLQKSINVGIVLSFPMASGTIITAPTIVSILAGSNFTADRILIAIISVSMIFQLLSNIHSYLIDLSRKTMWYNFIFFITSVFSVLISFATIPILGIYGAAFALLVTSILQALLTIYIGTKNANINIGIDYIFIFKALSSTIIMSVSLTYVYQNSGVLNFIISFVSGMLFYFLSFCLLSKITNTSLWP